MLAPGVYEDDACPSRFGVLEHMATTQRSEGTRTRYGPSAWSVHLVNPKGDKITRALAAQPTFAQGLVYAPVRDWSQMVIDEMELFPKGRYDDLTDSTTMAVSFLRSSGLLQTDAEAMAAEENTVMQRPRRLRPLYPC